MEIETGFYRSFQIINQPFKLMVSKSLKMDGVGHLTLYDLSVFAVYKTDPDANEVSVIILTESALNIVFTNFTILSEPFSIGDGSNSPFFTAVKYPLSGAMECLVTGENCFQFFEMTYDDGLETCPLDFSGTYALHPFFSNLFCNLMLFNCI